MLKYIVLIGVIYFFWWMLKRQLRLKKMQWKGEEVPEQKGLRPITLLSFVMVALYGGYMIWYMLDEFVFN